MSAIAIIEELTFTRCKNWNTVKCPNKKTPVMGLAAINWPHLYLLPQLHGLRLAPAAN